MAGKREKSQFMASKHRQVEILQKQGINILEDVRYISATQQTFYRSRKLYGGLDRSQLRRLWKLEKETSERREQCLRSSWTS